MKSCLPNLLTILLASVPLGKHKSNQNKSTKSFIKLSTNKKAWLLFWLWWCIALPYLSQVLVSILSVILSMILWSYHFILSLNHRLWSIDHWPCLVDSVYHPKIIRANLLVSSQQQAQPCGSVQIITFFQRCFIFLLESLFKRPQLQRWTVINAYLQFSASLRKAKSYGSSDSVQRWI